ncbi:hypothetical protein BFP72_06440 [Reichenbachiella sp. 5M10]|uniref:alpha/beta hydrolase n=1 Tax=Reichenbachiella sp. 5M10 TaxID=1889772 RepID=UPI000C14C7B7|nr:hypothetical protein [Reichenbachiella sp. 5M10]PIB35059.1 hypothetical protein BFP72_06440 [Reichenbachiella sp. 5M10]
MIGTRQVSFETTAPYHTLYELTEDTQYVWIVCHGYGQLSERFVRQFQVLDAKTNFVISLQGLSRFYLPGHQKVGASWMTKEGREEELLNQSQYFAAVLKDCLDGQDWMDYKVNLLGFSQGASAICRLAAHSRLDFAHLILWAGSFPSELSPESFAHLSEGARVYGVLGSEDSYYTRELFGTEVSRLSAATGCIPVEVTYDGGHELRRDVLSTLVSKF